MVCPCASDRPSERVVVEAVQDFARMHRELKRQEEERATAGRWWWKYKGEEQYMMSVASRSAGARQRHKWKLAHQRITRQALGEGKDSFYREQQTDDMQICNYA